MTPLFRCLPLLLLALAACVATPPPAPPEAEEHLPPIARAAVEEWKGWGSPIIEGWPDARPADTAATDERFHRLTEYWYALPGNSGVARRLEVRRAGIAATLADAAYAADIPVEVEDDNQGRGSEAAIGPPAPPGAPGPEDIALYAHPAWSAAFIAFVARRAGISEAELPPAPTHARYIDLLLRRALADPASAPYLPYAPEERALQPGDLLCADRSGRPLYHWTQRLSERGRFRPMHCDVVIRTRPGVVEVIGGNVADMVVLRRFPADEQGHVLPAPPDKPVFLVVLAPNDGRVPETLQIAAAEATARDLEEPPPPAARPRRVVRTRGAAPRRHACAGRCR